MHEKLNYYFSMLTGKKDEKSHIVSKKEVISCLATAAGLDDPEKIDKKNPFIKVILSSGTSQGEYIDLSYDSSLFFAYLEIMNARVDEWYEEYFKSHSGYVRDISIIESQASKNIADKVRGDYVKDIGDKTVDSAVAYAMQLSTSWLVDCVCQSAANEAGGENNNVLKASISSYARELVSISIDNKVGINKGEHLKAV